MIFSFDEFLGILFVACPFMIFGTIIMIWGIKQIFYFTKYGNK
jgi:hypothetical protein